MDTQSIKWLRWAFNCKLWKPTAGEWLQANRCIQGEEMQRIERFVFQSPAISAMVGRLLLRKSVQTVTHLENKSIHFLRTSEGRPYLKDVNDLDVNVSHHGDWVVLALERNHQVGIDVMSLNRPINISIEEYFHLMRRQFTLSEWEQIKSADNSLHEFYRFWCLKESYVKATGVGLNLDLQKISFKVKEKLSADCFVISTEMRLDGSVEASDWLFEEKLLDSNHCVAVCTNPSPSSLSVSAVGSSTAQPQENYDSLRTNHRKQQKSFTVIPTSDLLSLETINFNVGVDAWNNFNNKTFSSR